MGYESESASLGWVSVPTLRKIKIKKSLLSVDFMLELWNTFSSGSEEPFCYEKYES